MGEDVGRVGHPDAEHRPAVPRQHSDQRSQQRREVGPYVAPVGPRVLRLEPDFAHARVRGGGGDARDDGREGVGAELASGVDGLAVGAAAEAAEDFGEKRERERRREGKREERGRERRFI